MTIRMRLPQGALPLVLATFALHAQASGDADEKTLDALTVSSGKTPQTTSAVPAVVESVNAQQMAETINVINTEDALKYMPSLQIRKRFVGDRNGIVGSRSSGTLVSARSLVYADGVLLSNLLGNRYDYPPRWGLVAPEEIDQIDVIYGPFSAAYSGNSMGAVINMKTRMPEQFEAHAKVQKFRQDFSLYGSDHSYQGAQESATLGGRSGAVAWWLSGNHIESRGHPMSFATANRSSTAAGGGDKVVSGAQLDTDPNGVARVIYGATGIDRTVQDNLKIKLAYDITPTMQLAYTLGIWQNKSDVTVESYLRDASGNPVYSGSVNIDGKKYTLNATTFQPSKTTQEHWMHGLSLKTDTRAEWDWEAVSSWYDYGKDIQRSPTVALPNAEGGGAGQIAEFDGTGWRTLDLKGVWRPDGLKGAHQVSFGYHYDRYKLDSRVFNTSDWLVGGTTTRVSAFAGKTETHAVFAQDAWRFAPSWQLTLGGRLERWHAFDGITANASSVVAHGERANTYFSPKAALSLDVANDWVLRGSFGKAYRMPTVQELFQGSVSSGAIVNNNPGLRPEKALSGELTAEHALESGLLRVSLFQENAKDALYSQTDITVTPTVTNIQNIDEIRTRGVEVVVQRNDAFIRGLDLSGSVTAADSTIRKNGRNPSTIGKAQPRVPDWRATGMVTYRPSDALAYTLAARYSGRQYNTIDNTDSNPNTYGGVSKFFVVDARVHYKLNKQWSAAVGIDNLNNEKYYVAHPYPQRSLVAELKFDL